jgi:hypothetical protein
MTMDLQRARTAENAEHPEIIRRQLRVAASRKMGET